MMLIPQQSVMLLTIALCLTPMLVGLLIAYCWAVNGTMAWLVRLWRWGAWLTAGAILTMTIGAITLWAMI